MQYTVFVLFFRTEYSSLQIGSGKLHCYIIFAIFEMHWHIPDTTFNICMLIVIHCKVMSKGSQSVVIKLLSQNKPVTSMFPTY